MSIGSDLYSPPSLPVPLRQRGFRLAVKCFVLQLVLGLAAALAGSLDQNGGAAIAQPASALIPVINLVMWLSLFSTFLYNWLRGRNQAQDQQLLMSQLAAILRLGVPLNEALEGLSRHQASNWRSRWSDTRRSVLRLLAECQRGDNLGQAMSRDHDFPPHWAPLLESAEEQGILLEALENIQLGRSDRPYFTTWFWIRLFCLWFVALPVAFFLVTYILPTFVAIFEGMSLSLPLLTRSLILFIKWAQSPPGLVLQFALPLGMIAAVVASYLNRPFAIWINRKLALIPPFNQVIPLQDQASLATTLAICLRLGLDHDRALKIAALAVDHPAYRRALLAGGASLPDIMDAHPALFSPPLRWLTRQGLLHGNLAAALNEAAGYLATRADESKLRWSMVLETGMTVLLGLMVTVLVLGTYLPIIQVVMNMLETTVLP
ncbi:MAG: type II secretion system F family protein [Vulcanimicrobiota bacterium]